MGRPKKDPDERKERSFRMRMTEEEFRDLEYISEFLNLTKSDVVRSAIDALKENFNFSRF